MDKDIKFSPRGIWSASAIAEAPKGGLSLGEEIVIRAPGIAEPRPGFSRATTLETAAATAGIISAWRLIDYGARALLVGKKSGGVQYAAAWDNNVAVTEDATGRSDLKYFDDGTVMGLEVRKNLYLTTNDGPRKLTSGSDTSMELAGVGVAGVEVFSSSTGGEAVLVDKYVAYSVLVKREDANGVVFRGAPSGRAIFKGSTSTRYVLLRLWLHKAGHVRVGDTIEVYRTLNETALPPTNELYLVGSVVVVSGDLTTGFISVTDNTPDGETGQSLYTNPSEEGVEAAHLRPPAARCMEYFNGSLFLGRLAYPAAQTFSYSALLTAGAAVGAQIGSHALAGTFTNGSASVLVADSSLFRVGQIADDAGSDWTSGSTYTYISSIPDATHVEFNHTWNGFTGAASRNVVDSIRVGSLYFPANTIRALRAGIKGTDTTGLSTAAAQTAAAVDIEILSDDSAFLAVAGSARIQFRFQAVNAWDTAPVIYATNGALYEPPLPEPTATGYSLPVETIEEGLAWSNYLEPEHFTGVNVERVGQGGKNVLALKAVKNALLVFKEDGVYRVSGASADSGFRIDELDKSCKLLTPDSATVLGDKVYAAGDLAVFECDENGISDISSPAIDDTFHSLGLRVGIGNYAALGVWTASNRKDDEVLLSIPVAGLEAGSYIYVFNRAQGAWTRWFVSQTQYHGVYRQSLNLLWILDAGTGSLRTERSANDSVSTADAQYSITVSAVTGTAVTIAGASGWTPAIGDMVLQSGTRYLVTAITDATHFTVHKSGLTAAAGASYVGYESVICPIAFVAAGPQDMKTWGEGSVLWHKLQGARYYRIGWTSSLSDTEVITDKNVSTDLITSDKQLSYRMVTPRRHARTDRLYPAIKIKQAGALWGLEGISLNVRIAGDRLRNRK